MKTIEIPGMGGPSPERQAAADAVNAQHEYVAGLIEDAPPDTNGHAVVEEVAGRQRESAEADMRASYVQRRSVAPSKIEKVELTYVADPEKDTPGFKLTFKVLDICVRDNYISLALPPDGEFNFQPGMTMRFDLKFRGQLKPVIFAGSEFEFQSLGVRGISFIVDSKRQQRYDQTRQS